MEMYIPKSFRQVLALILCLAMLMSYAVPAGATETATTEESQETENSGTMDSQATESGISGMSDNVEYVSLPVTIRDFAADGMLFEFNQINKSSSTYAPWKTYEFLIGSLSAESEWRWDTNDNLGFRIRTFAVHGADLPDAYDYWYCVICNSDGSIKQILPSGQDSKTGYATYMTEGCYAIWLWIADGDTEAHEAQYQMYKEFESLVNEETQHRYHLNYTTDGTLTIGVEYLEYNGKKYILGDNNGFTLLVTDESDYVNNLLGDDSIAGTTVVRNNTNGTTPPDPVTVTLNSGAPQTIYGGNMRLDLVEPTLDKDKKPIYTEATVAYLANLLQTMLQVPYYVELGGETYYMGYYILGTNLFDKNFNYVGQDSADAQFGLADVLRNNINGGLGSYAESQARFTAGELRDPADADTYFDAAYYLLHSLWRDGTLDAAAPGSDGYGWNTWNYDKINLIQTTNANGEKCYVFNSGYDDVKYDYYWSENGIVSRSGSIYNTQVETITAAQHPGTNGEYNGGIVYSSGVVLPNARFDPLGQSGSGLVFGYGMNAGTYCALTGVYPDRGEIFYPETNYHLSLEGHAKFIYYADADQYFTFTGDDDVYLYINGKRVLDLGGAHAIARVKINLNDVATLCGLSDGMTYDFDFYYIERHGTAANFGIETNIQIVDPSMLTTKQGYQNGEPTGYNGYVNPDIPVTYEFGLENNGESSIQNLTFSDPTIGVSMTKDAISLNALTTINDLSVTLYGSDGTVKSSVAAGSLTEDVLKQYLETGLGVDEKIVIHGFSYKILNGDWQQRTQADGTLSNLYFFNIIYTTATAVGDNNSTKELTGSSNWVVQQLDGEAMGALTITKQLAEDASADLGEKTFTIQVLLDGEPIPVGTVYTYTDTDGNKTYPSVQKAGQITLKAGETVKLRAADGTTFQVSELIDSEDREVYRATYEAVNAEATDSGVTGTFTENAAAAVTVTNHIIPGGLVETNKYVTATEDPNKFTLTLESFVKGQLTNVATTTPADFILVLDQSASMYAPAGGRGGYDNETLLDPDTLSSYVTSLDPSKAQHMGYYIAQSSSGRGIDDNTTVYDWFVVQYIDGKWYYVRMKNTSEPVNLDVNYTGSENVIGETLVRDEPITTFHYYQTGYGALYDAVTGFVDGLEATGADHRVAVVGFASPFYDAMEHFDGSGVYVNGEYYLYDTEYLKDDGGTYSYIYKGGQKYYLTDDQIAALPTVGAETVYDQALVSVKDNYNSIKASLNAVTTNYWHTCPAAGLDMANQILAQTPANGRNRTVLLFTDGVPTVRLEADYEKSKNWETNEDGLYIANTYWTVAEGKDSAIEQAYITKNTYGANIHTIGTAGAEADILFLKGVSSDYPNATSYPTTFTNDEGVLESYKDSDPIPSDEEILEGMGDLIADPMFSHFASEELTLDAIFEKILQSTTTLDLGADAVLKEVLTDYFVLDNNSEVDVKVYTAAYNGDGTFADPVLRTEDEGFKVTLSSSDGSSRNDTIEVTGFDYAAEFISETARTDAAGNDYYGSKLIVEVQIETRAGFWGGNNVPTNEDTTAIYEKDGDLVDKFPEPQVNVPITVTVDVEDKTIYYNGSLDSDSDGKEGDELIKTVTIGGQEVTVNNDGTFTPQADWMDDFANASWTDDSTTPSSDLSNTEPKDYIYTVTVTPKTDGTQNTQDNPSNIAGNVDGGEILDEDLAESSKSASDTGHVFILVPELIFKDSTTDFGTPADGYDHDTNNYVDKKIVWTDMEGNRLPGDGIPELDADAVEPELTLTYTPDDSGENSLENGAFVTDTKVNVTVSIDGQDITKLVKFDWQDDCTFGDHTADMDITKHDGTATSNEFWVHVTLNIVPDTVVIDYGLDVVIDVLSNDPKLGDKIVPTLTGIGANTESVGTTAVSGEFGQLSIDSTDSSKVRYALNTSNGMQINKEEVFTYQATYTIKEKPVALSSTVTVIPATIIYYEDKFVDFTVWNNSDASPNQDADKQWTPTSEAGNADQAQDRPGEEQLAVDAGNIYGYDGVYTNMATYSMGSAMKVTVNNDLFAEAQFTFYGTGFDVISLTSGTTGTIMVDVYNAADFAENSYGATPVATRMVDTYYGYKYALCEVTYLWRTDDNGEYFWERNVGEEVAVDTQEQLAELPKDPAEGQTVSGIERAWIVVDDAADSLYQVPVMKVNGLTYGQYTVVITVAYMDAVDHQGEGFYDFYLDAIRIYDPANDGKNLDGTVNEVIQNAYVADGEGWPEYFEVRNWVISRNDFDVIVNDDTTESGVGKGMVFIDNTLDDDYKWTYTITDYTNYGPNNELYLAPGQAIAFHLNVPNDVETLADGTTVEHPAGIHLALKTVGAYNAAASTAASVSVYDASGDAENSVLFVNGNPVSTIESATDLYYDISALNGKTVVIVNTSEEANGAILSITNIKVTHAVEHDDEGIAPESYFTINAEAAEASTLSLRRMVASDAEEETPETEATEPETTVPEVTEPETTVPEDTEPETTVPEVTEPEVTEPEVFKPRKFEVRVSDSTPSKNSTVVVTVTTTADVDHITVNGKKVTKYTTSWFGGSRVWSTWITAEEAGEMDVSVICYNAEDLASEAVTKTITVSEKSLMDKIWDLIGGWLKP